MEVDVQNIFFDKLQHRVVQSHRVPTLDIHVSPIWVIVFDLRRHHIALTYATKAYTKATILSIRFLIVENECMAKELQATK